MAPSFDIGNPLRSLVRIPGSGQDKALKPICLDVAQISNFSKSLSLIIHFNFDAPPSTQEATNGRQESLANRKRSSEDEVSSQQASKRPRTLGSSIRANKIQLIAEFEKYVKSLPDEEREINRKELFDDLSKNFAFNKNDAWVWLKEFISEYEKTFVLKYR
ncbi:hypothetical protein IIV31_156R [Armadillidium vulgare iridescent virus]|uniref:Uncharacterized protein n=1 Tax=Armadillidium vulgare iridescent virus TaxID=72201 RepID=A0A068QKY6_9VIRU|nr:hypothetical protein IIV31_156R [Armadillidium vulgare iridescent virus]CCV02528.1 hypothetical protein IIV31_156R [Armadillidium vulgare iridescent virus]